MNFLKFILRKTGLLSSFYAIINKYNPTFDCLSPGNLIALIQSIKVAKDGDYYEFGVYKGFDLWFMTKLAEEYNHPDMRFFGFDSFKGLPVPKSVDVEPDAFGNYFAKGCFSASLGFVLSNLKQHGTDLDKVTLIEGYFSESLNKQIIENYGMRKASIILIDCDMYESTIQVLNFIVDILQEGTILLFDDWLLTDENKGEQLAFKEWLEENPSIRVKEFITFGLGKGFVVNEL